VTFASADEGLNPEDKC